MQPTPVCTVNIHFSLPRAGADEIRAAAARVGVAADAVAAALLVAGLAGALLGGVVGV